jgi:CDP-diacylglycerol--glycerol-3-phosphate 3-phosphatidyltransferase
MNRAHAKLIPLALTSARVLLAPLMLFVAYGNGSGILFVLILALGLFTDVFDGILARRLGVSSPALRRYDSAADVLFYVAVLWSAWLTQEAAVREFAWGLGAVLGLEILCQAISFAKFRRPPATHAYIAKAWAFVLFAGFAALLGFGATTPWLEMLIVVGVVADLDVILIMFMSRRQPVDVPSCYHAWRLRRLARPQTSNLQ